MHDMFTMREKPSDKIGWHKLNLFDIGGFILEFIFKIKRSSVHFQVSRMYTMEINYFQINMYVNMSFLKSNLLNCSYSAQQ